MGVRPVSWEISPRPIIKMLSGFLQISRAILTIDSFFGGEQKKKEVISIQKVEKAI